MRKDDAVEGLVSEGLVESRKSKKEKKGKRGHSDVDVSESTALCEISKHNSVDDNEREHIKKLKKSKKHKIDAHSASDHGPGEKRVLLCDEEQSGSEGGVELEKPKKEKKDKKAKKEKRDREPKEERDVVEESVSENQINLESDSGIGSKQKKDKKEKRKESEEMESSTPKRREPVFSGETPNASSSLTESQEDWEGEEEPTGSKYWKRIDEDKWKGKVAGTKFAKISHYDKGGDSWGNQAADVLSKVKGKGFVKAMQKLKRASWKGQGNIDTGINSVQFSDWED